MYFDNTKIISKSDDYNLFQIDHVHFGRHLSGQSISPSNRKHLETPTFHPLGSPRARKKIIQIWALQMIDPAKRSQPKCNSQQRQNTAPEFVGFIQHQITRKLQKVHAKVKIKMVIINRIMPILTDN